MVMTQDLVTKPMPSTCTRYTTGMMRKNCGFVAKKMETTCGSLSMVCFYLNLLVKSGMRLKG